MSSNDRSKRSDSPSPTSASSSWDTAAQQIVAALPDLIFEFSADGYYSHVHSDDDSDLYCSPEEFLGEHFSDVLPQPVVEEFDAAFTELGEHGQPITMSYMLPIDAELQYFECRLLPMETGHILALIRNMTDSWRAKTELEQSETRYRTLVNNIPGIVYRCHLDEEWSAVYVSPAIEELVGYPAQDFMTRRRSLSGVTHPEDRQRVRREVMNAVKEQRSFQMSYRMIDADGQVRQVTERGQAVYAEFDEVNYLDGVVIDVTEVHQMRQRLLLNTKMAAVGNLAAGVAHEINNPLAIAMANLDFIADELRETTDTDNADSTDGIRDALSKVQGSIDRVRSIIDDLRTFTDAADGRAQQLDLQRLTQWAIERARSRSESTEAIHTDLHSVPTIWASEVGVVQVIWNLLHNGLEALERRKEEGGHVVVTLRQHDDRVILQVCDNGPGMSDDIANRAFEPFFTTKPVGQGAGLGLFVCQGLVEGMDGSIDFETNPGEGTCIQISFPTYEAPYTGANDQ